MTLPLLPVADPDLQFNLDKIASTIGGSPLLHTGDTAGGDLTGTYPNPQLAANSVGTSELQGGIVLRLAITGTARFIVWGSTTVTFNANNDSDVGTITHGLGTTPSIVLATAIGSGSPDNRIVYATSNYTGTTFDIRGFHPPGNITATPTFAWAAVG